jgi:predicted ester cyclase
LTPSVKVEPTNKRPVGSLPPTGRRVEFEEIVILQIRDGKVRKQRGIVDNLSALRQLGVVPSPRS